MNLQYILHIVNGNNGDDPISSRLKPTSDLVDFEMIKSVAFYSSLSKERKQEEKKNEKLFTQSVGCYLYKLLINPS